MVAAYKLPKATDEEKAARQRRHPGAMTPAIAAPLDVMRRAPPRSTAASWSPTLGNPNASSDVGVALELLAAGLRGARLNVEINLGSIKDAAFAVARGSEVVAAARPSAISSVPPPAGA